ALLICLEDWTALTIKNPAAGLAAGSVFANRAGNSQWFDCLIIVILVMTVEADCRSRRATVLFARVGVHLMARDAGREFRPRHRYVPDITQHMPVAGIQTGVISLGEIHLVVLEKIIAWNKVIRIRKPGRPGVSRPQVALRAGRLDRLSVFLALFREKNQRRIVGVLEIDIAMAGIAVEPKSRESQGLGIHSRRMTACTAV